MNIGIVTATFPFGPAETFLRFELDALSSLGYTLTLFPATPRTKKSFHPDLCARVARFALLAPKTLEFACRGFFINPRAALYALATIAMSKNAIGTKLKNLLLFPTGLAVAYQARRLHIDHLHAYWLSGASTVAFIASIVAGIDWSFSAHSWDIFMTNNLIPEKARAARFGRAISELGRRGILRYSPEAASRLHVIHLGVDPIYRGCAATQSDTGGKLRLICAADLIPVKGHRYLLDAIRKVIDAGIRCQCVFAGEGPLRSALQRRARELKIDRFVSMPGRVRHDTLLQELGSGSYDAMVLASVSMGTEFEGIPVSLMEAMAAGIPCIATNTGAIPELIDDDCGMLVPERDPSALANAIMQLASDPVRRNAIRERAIQRIEENFNARISAQTLSSLMGCKP
jgi:colanic acid/amylovoran biosynthesis glycosyltransferase